MALKSQQSSFKVVVDGEPYEFTETNVTGRQIRSTVGLTPASEFILILIESRSARSIGLDETVDLSSLQDSYIRSFRSDRTYSFTINERGFEWGTDTISAEDIRRIALVPEEHDLVLDSSKDKAISDGEFVRLSSKGVERIRSQNEDTVCIFVNTRKKEVARGKISFEELTALAFPDAPYGNNTAYTVGFRKGGGASPSGTLVAGEKVRVVKGMMFNVTATDKS